VSGYVLQCNNDVGDATGCDVVQRTCISIIIFISPQLQHKVSQSLTDHVSLLLGVIQSSQIKSKMQSSDISSLLLDPWSHSVLSQVVPILISLWMELALSYSRSGFITPHQLSILQFIEPPMG
jgi:hypothetical protein